MPMNSVSLTNKVIIVTGASQGLGRQIARRCVRLGAHIVITGRSKKRLKGITSELELLKSAGQKIVPACFDVQNIDDCAAVVNSAIQDLGSIHTLINNAGIWGQMGRFADEDIEAWLESINVNLIGSVYMIKSVLPHFQEINGGRIIQLSGGGATNPMPNFSSYAASKAGIVRFVESVAQEVVDHGIMMNCVAPGALDTKMLDEVLQAGPEKVGVNYYEAAQKRKLNGGASIEKILNLVTFLLSESSFGITGKLISAQWDNWSQLPRYMHDANFRDVFTLRRIIGKERGMMELDV